MPVRIRGGTILADAEVEFLSKALRITHRSLDYGVGGSFHLTSKTGVMSAGLSAGSPIYSFRVASSSLLAIVRRIKISAWSIAGFAAGLGSMNMFRATSWSAPDSGGTIDTITVNNAKLRTSMASIAALAEVRHSSTGALSPGTRTKDNHELESLNVNVTTATNTAFIPTMTLFHKMPGEHPLVLALNEGIMIEATVPATGTWTCAITTEWEEVGTF
jgi:hypothetical protein